MSLGRIDVDWIYPGMWSGRKCAGNLYPGERMHRKILHIKKMDLPPDITQHIILQYKNEILRHRYKEIYMRRVFKELLLVRKLIPHSESCPVLHLLAFFAPPAMAC
jgi:hypothetical protein